MSDVHKFISGCCHQFNIYDGTVIKCSQCNRIISNIEDDDIITINIKYNTELESNISGDVIKSTMNISSRFSDDPTRELSANKCPKCGAYSRYSRNQQGQMYFICSNTKCRHVFE
jgi:ssDNA-binding Zn-finger/Zn-ribbon topoisomerase 1